MVNKRKDFGKTWETEVFNTFLNGGLDAWHLGFTERADILVVNSKDRIFECKASHERVYDFRKNKKQHERFIEYLESHPGTSGYYAFKFTWGRKSVKFLVYALDTKYLKWIDPMEEGVRKFTFDEVISHIRDGVDIIKEMPKSSVPGVISAKSDL